MSEKRVYIKGLGAYLPEKILTNEDLTKMVDTSDEWIRTRTGIQTRHIARDDEYTSKLTANAARRAMADANVAPEDIDFVIVSTVTPDMGGFPCTANFVQRELGLKKAPAMDIEAACSGMIYALELGASLLQRGHYKNILVIAGDKLSSLVNWKDRSTCVLFGDGSGACVLSTEKEGAKAEILDAFLHSDYDGVDLLRLPAGGSRCPASISTVEQGLHYIHMEGQEVFKLAVKGMSSAADTILKRNHLDAHQIRWFIPHQANLRIIDAVAKYLNVDREHFYLTIAETGNTSSASIGIALTSAYEKNTLKNGDYVVLVGFGAGMSSGSMLIQWC